jgi:hypothetical protein
MVVSECAKRRYTDPWWRLLDDWLDDHMHWSLHQPVDMDGMIPSIVYTVKIPMTDDHWANYREALGHFPDARDLHNLLVKDKDELDQITRIHQDFAGRSTWALLTQPGKTLEEMMAGMVKGDRLSIPWDRRRPTERPELLPEELGGKLRGYPEP